MKIVMICDFYNESLEYQENLLAKYYTKHGHSTTVIASTYESVFDYYTDKYDNSIPSSTYYHGKTKIIKLRNRFKIRFNLMNRLRVYDSFSKVLQQEKPDLIYVHDIMPNILDAVKYKKKHANCKIILDYHADYSNSGRNWLSLKVLHGVIRKQILDKARPHISKIFPIVPAGAVFLNEVYNVPYSEMELLPLGADTDLGAQVRQQQEGQSLRSSLGITNEETVIFTGGKLTPRKRTELLIRAIRDTSQLNAHLIIVGDAPRDEVEYKNFLIREAKDCSRIHFIGWVDSRKIYSYLNMADLAVFPASQSILWQQAISMGLPLIVGNTGYQDISYLNLYKNIIILDNKDIRSEKISEVVGHLIRDPDRMAMMRQGAFRVSDECLNWNKLILKTLQIN